MKTTLSIFLFCCCVLFAQAQEICDNAIDDDQDGQIDLNDDDCRCKVDSSERYILNPSFEERSCCPMEFSEMDCVDYWIQASSGTSDYLNLCGFFDHATIPSVPLPLPDGDGFSGFYEGSSRIVPYKEYIGTCLVQPLEEDSLYKVQFDVGFGREKPTGGNIDTLELAIYGTSNCGEIPFSGADCPTNQANPNWIELAEVIVAGRNEWKTVEISFIALNQIEGLLNSID